MSSRADGRAAPLGCVVIEVTCGACRARLRRQASHDVLDALLARPRCPECGGRLDVVRLLGHAAQVTDWERPPKPDDGMSWMEQRDCGMRHCE
jgi:hypothetical protein